MFSNLLESFSKSCMQVSNFNTEAFGSEYPKTLSKDKWLDVKLFLVPRDTSIRSEVTDN